MLGKFLFLELILGLSQFLFPKLGIQFRVWIFKKKNFGSHSDSKSQN
jgi:hypothetical protein